MKLYIEFIKQILESGGLIMDCYNMESYFVMNSPASIENITQCETYFHKKLPEEYKFFLRYYNGGSLFKCDIAGFKFLSAQEIIEVNELQKEIYEEYWDGSIIFFCELIGNGEYLGFKTTDPPIYEIVHSMMAQKPKEWIVAGNSFDTLIETIIKEKGKEYWLFQPTN
jgi:hypothetical protein